MVVAYPVDDETAAAIAEGALEWRPDGSGTISGPGCVVCNQGLAAAELPCPGRVWPDEEAPYKRGKAALSRAERRQRDIDDRRAFRKHRCEQCHLPIEGDPVVTLTGRKVCGRCAGGPTGFITGVIPCEAVR